MTPTNQDSASGKAGQARPDDATSTRRNKTHILSFNPKAGTATITASIGNVTATIDVAVHASQPGGETKNVVYAAKPNGWNTLYAYVYSGDGASAKSNASWPGVAMTQLTADDGCAKTGMYRYEVPDLGTGTYRVIFNDGGSQQTPGAQQAGMELKGTMAWTGGDTLNTLSCQTVPPADMKWTGFCSHCFIGFWGD